MFVRKGRFVRKPFIMLALYFGLSLSGRAVRGGNDPDQRAMFAAPHSQAQAAVLNAEQKAAI